MNKYFKRLSKYNKLPVVEIKNDSYKVEKGWQDIFTRLNNEILAIDQKKSWW